MEDIPEPEPGPGAVKLRVAWCGLCGTDVAEYKYGPLGAPDERPHPLTGATVPVVLGHEVSGTIVEAGPGVVGIEVGDRVLLDPLIRCGSCPHCLHGRYNLCDLLAVHGLSGGGGGLAEYTVVPDYTVHRIPDSLDLADAPMAEPLAVGLRAVARSRFNPGERVALFGAGPIGLVLAALLLDMGVGRLDLVEPSPFRRQLGLDLGADLAVSPDNLADLGDTSAKTNGGYDIVFETTGVPDSLANAVSVTRAGGHLIHVAKFKQPGMVDINRFRREITLVSTQAYLGEIPEAIELAASGRLDLGRIVTHRTDLENVVAEGFERLSAVPAMAGKVLVNCQTDRGR